MSTKSMPKKILSFVLAISTFLTAELFSFESYATDKSVKISGNAYAFEPKGSYEISNASKIWSAKIGEFAISGNIKEADKKDGVRSFIAESGNITLSYTFDTFVLSREETAWRLSDDTSKKIDDVELKNKIGSGAIILQTSLDRKRWVTISDAEVTNAFTSASNAVNNFYTTQDIQLQNGCYYRAIVAYKLVKKMPSSQIAFWEYDNNYEYNKIAELYEFYAENADKKIKASDVPRKVFDEGRYKKKKMALDSGYAKEESITKDDPHYGWDIGIFSVNGYTEKIIDNNNKPIFLKNVGDRVTLWFKLNQDISNINGNKDLSVAEDSNGYDLAFETKQTNFKRGALLIRYTDSQGVKHDPIIYTDFLAANASPGADTKAQLFEEGDYEVALDYELRVNGVFPKHTNYRIFFEFSIRNSNCMVYPFDIKTNAELTDNAITPNGFKLDMAKSKYLSINVQKEAVVSDSSGNKKADVRFNRAAKDGDKYDDEGIYTFTVKNEYTKESTTKTIYVGIDPFLKALSKTGKTINELNNELDKGTKISNDGSLIYTTTTTTAPETAPEIASETVNEATTTETITAPITTTVKPEETVAVMKPAVTATEEPLNTKEDNSNSGTTTALIIVGIVLIITIIAAVIIIIKKLEEAKRPTIGDSENNDNNSEGNEITKESDEQ